MIRRIIEIDQDKCNGCGACSDACHEGAIAMVDGKAKLMRDDYCDGLGDCLPVCPTGAITFVEREAAAYDEAAVLESKKKQEEKLPCGCPGSAAKAIRRQDFPAEAGVHRQSQLRQWPVQIKLAPVNAPWFDGAKLLVAADCTAYAYASFHQDFIRGRITLVGCPKLDSVDYSEGYCSRLKVFTRITTPLWASVQYYPVTKNWSQDFRLQTAHETKIPSLGLADFFGSCMQPVRQYS